MQYAYGIWERENYALIEERIPSLENIGYWVHGERQIIDILLVKPSPAPARDLG